MLSRHRSHEFARQQLAHQPHPYISPHYRNRKTRAAPQREALTTHVNAVLATDPDGILRNLPWLVANGSDGTVSPLFVKGETAMPRRCYCPLALLDTHQRHLRPHTP